MVENEKMDGRKVNGQVLKESSGGSKKSIVQENRPTNLAKPKAAVAKEKLIEKREKVREKTNPPGGKDDTPIPSAEDGYTVQFAFHGAENLPVSDIKARSSDPYILATLTSPGIEKRHKEDPDMVFRTKTIHKSTNPEWDQHWIVANIPSKGFKLECRLYDEDTKDHDDRLGNVTISVNNISESWPGIREQVCDVKKRMGSKRAYLLKGCLSMLFREVHMGGRLFLSIKVLGKSEPPFGRMYTVGPVTWIKHYSPMIGRLAGTKNLEKGRGGEGKVDKYDFQANEFQLRGPVPPSLYHRFVEFKPFVKGMFLKVGLRGRILNKALHHQHNRIYNFGADTEYGTVESMSKDASKKFLEMVHYDEGGRIFTYVITLDGLMRFTETGKEFGIGLLSKHTMHSDVQTYIAYSGEFFVRRLAKSKNPGIVLDQETQPTECIPSGPSDELTPKDPKNYELIIDNDSGTYRPKGDLLGDLKKFLKDNFPGLHIVVKEWTDKKLSKMKDEQREIKKTKGQTAYLVQNSDSDISSDDDSMRKHLIGILVANVGQPSRQRTERLKSHEEP